MRRAAAVLLLMLTGIAIGCGNATDPAEGCRGHGGLAHPIGHDATNSAVPFDCKDGTVGKLHL